MDLVVHWEMLEI